MQIKRTACAGVLLSLDGHRILMDGVCREVKPYPATPPKIRQSLLEDSPDALLITHKHLDHYDGPFISQYAQNTAGPILGPADIPFTGQNPVTLGSVKITPLESRHIGKSTPMGHMSFILEGSRCVWFLGDASPLLWKNRTDLPKPDVMVVPYAYGMGSGWELCKTLGATAVVLLHLPEKANDPYGLWDAVEETVKDETSPNWYIPAMGEEINI